jgi:hypothetical protein
MKHSIHLDHHTMTPRELIENFYKLLSNKKYNSIAQLYHQDASFTDGIFSVSGQIEGMWHFMCGIANDFTLTVKSIEQKNNIFVVNWESFYFLNGKRIHNILTSTIKLQGNKIIEQRDEFSFYRIARQTGGTKGVLLGWLPAARTAIRSKMLIAFDDFLLKNPKYKPYG